MLRFICNILKEYRWFRQMIGGHWERYWMGNLFSTWAKPEKCEKETYTFRNGNKPYKIECEDYSKGDT